MARFGNIHRYFIQFLMKNGAVTVDESIRFCSKLNPEINTPPQIRDIVSVINGEINKHNFKLIVAKCEITERELVLWLNLNNDKLSRLQTTYTVVELEYFHKILHTILSTDHYRITKPICYNLISNLTGRLQRNDAERVLNDWIANQYFISEQNYIYLGKRLIMEFQPYLSTHLQNCKCGLCFELTFYGKMCNLCSTLYHNYCIDGYLKKRQICPNCNKRWIEAEFIPSQFTSSQETTMEI